ncbi:MAG: isoprenyl transferase [Parvimonas sp.]|nr:isoprenyl transferase [Parvimonas sp.]
MDGNGRWAKNRFMPRITGHKEGMNRVVDIVEECCKIGIETLTLYAFSTENWKRPKDEVNGLMDILVIYINSQLKRILENNIIFRVVGDYSKLPKSIVKLLDDSIEKTKLNTGMVLNIALNYGGRSEIISAIKSLCKDIFEEKISLNDLDEENFKNYLYTRENSDVDLIIRTGNEKRISNFLIYQIAYSEFYFTDVLWPEFFAENLYDAIYDFQNRNRRFGGV